ncbi:cuticle protein 16.5 isoform X2 [Folsomia candida]|uniref:cuticle protein 16.5 isoform X2 n=1 Tax=Folsomia candida TaxID=158441 RepID=UPI001604EE17|nr:cuticle protein 16.5 isoform X2 [Folsomia candida]
MLQIIDEQSTPTDIKGGIAVQDIIQAYSFQQLLTLTFEVPLHPKINMQSVAVFLAVVGVAAAGGLTGFGYQTGVQHAAIAQPIAVAQPALAVRAAPLAYSAPAFAAPAYAAGPAYAAPVATYAHAAPVATYAAAPVLAKAVVPAAQSFAYNNRAPAARVAIAAAPVATYAHAAPVLAAGPVAAYGAGPIGYGAPALRAF